MQIQLSFGQRTIGSAEAGADHEWLVTNGIGGYAAGTISGLRTRVYHGLLVAADEPPVGRRMLVPGLDERVTYRGRTYELSAIRWHDGTMAPSGHNNCERFYLDGAVPVWRFRLADALLERRVWMVHGRNETRISYRLLWAADTLELSAKLFASDRNHHSAARGRPNLRTSVEGGRLLIFRGTQAGSAEGSQSPLLLVESPDADRPLYWRAIGDVYEGTRLSVETYRGLPDREDLFAAAECSFGIEPGDTAGLRLVERPSTGAAGAADKPGAPVAAASRTDALLTRFDERVEGAGEAPPWIRQLVLAADQFIVDRTLDTGETGKTIIAGYPWFGDWGRDTMISLPGLTIATGRYEEAAWILRTFARYVDGGMLPNLFPDGSSEPEYNTVDAALWYFEAVRAYLAATNDLDLAAELFPVLTDIVEAHHAGTRYGIGVDEADGLLYAGEPGVQLTWMDARVGDWVVTPRRGKAVEINALWHHALAVTASVAQRLGEDPVRYLRMARRTAASFTRFRSTRGLADVIDGVEGADGTVRPNQVFAVSLAAARSADPHCPTEPLLADAPAREVVDVIAAELLTPAGLRSLAPGDTRYAGRYGGDATERDAHYHQGPVWGWLAGPFAQAHHAVYGNPAASRGLLEPQAELLSTGCVGQLSEIYDGDAPYIERGAFAQAWTVAKTIEAWVSIGSHI